MSSLNYDHLIVGAGFAGATMARCLAEAGKRVLIIDKRDHIGGNAYDYVNDHGVRIHKYGPHIFHTNSDQVFGWLSQFTEWRPYEHRVLASVEGKLVPFPINLTTLELVYGRSFTAHEAQEFLAAKVAHDWPGGEVRNAEDQIVSQVGRELFELFFAGYSKKMWGVEARDLDKSVTARIPIRFTRDDRYFTDKHQAMPKGGYTALFERMLDHANIEIRLNRPWHSKGAMAWEIPRARHLIWTGPIDEYLGYRFGPLPYRSMEFVHVHHAPAAFRFQPISTINFPQSEVRPTRETSWSHLEGGHELSDLTVEHPTAEGEPYYPMPTPQSRALYKRYEALADQERNVTFMGRLGRYQYINMDQAVGQALSMAGKLLSANAPGR